MQLTSEFLDAARAQGATVTITFPPLSTPVIEGDYSVRDEPEVATADEIVPWNERRKSAHRKACEALFNDPHRSATFVPVEGVNYHAMHQAMRKAGGDQAWATVKEVEGGFFVEKKRGFKSRVVKDTIRMTRQTAEYRG